MLGYKTTDNIRDAITDLAVMNMRGNYNVEDYKTFLKSQKTQIAEFLDEFMIVIHEYRQNLQNGKSKATVVHDLLNSFIDDDTNMRMGDLLNSETLQDKVGVEKSIEAENPGKLPNLVTILMQGNTRIIKTMELLLSMAADTNDNSWIDRFAEQDYDMMLDQLEDERPDLNTMTKRVRYLDNLYGGEALALGEAIVSLRSELLDYENGDLHVGTATEEEIRTAFGDVTNVENSADLASYRQYEEWLRIGTIYEGLNDYEGGLYGQGELLDFFLEENDPEDVELYIPLAAALSPGQICGLPFVNFETLIEYAFSDEASWAQQAQKTTNGLTKSDALSVYENIDRGLYQDDGSVAFTDAAQRAQNVGSLGTTGSEESQTSTLTVITRICYAATAISCVSAVRYYLAAKSQIDSAVYTRASQLLYGQSEAEFNQAAYNAIFDEDAYGEFLASGTDVNTVDLVNRTRFTVYLSHVFIVATIVLAVVSAVLTIIDLLSDESVEQLPIPMYLVDQYTNGDGGTYQLNYKAVECNRMEYFGENYKKQKGSCADLLADEGEQWLALYASKNSQAGRPILAKFVVKDANEVPRDCSGCIHLFGEQGALDLASDAFMHYSSGSVVWQAVVTGTYHAFVFYQESIMRKTYDESAGNMTATTMSSGTMAIFGFGGVALGAVLGAVVTNAVKKKKKATEQ